MSIYQGDPAIKIDADGATNVYREGQPIMDGGFENAVLISLFTKENWVGNVLTDNTSEQIGSKFEQSMKEPINIEGLNSRRDAAEKSLKWAVDDGLFKSVTVNVTNPRGNIILVNIRIEPPNGEAVNLTLDNAGANWRIQKENPAHGRF